MKRILKAVLSAGFITTAFFTGVTGNIANAAISEFTDEILTYEIVKGGVNISACDDGAVELNIRDEIDGYKIIGINENAFAECTNLKKVTLPDTITTMGAGAFTGCTSLESINVPAGLTEIPA